MTTIVSYTMPGRKGFRDLVRCPKILFISGAWYSSSLVGASEQAEKPVDATKDVNLKQPC